MWPVKNDQQEEIAKLKGRIHELEQERNNERELGLRHADERFLELVGMCFGENARKSVREEIQRYYSDSFVEGYRYLWVARHTPDITPEMAEKITVSAFESMPVSAFAKIIKASNILRGGAQ